MIPCLLFPRDETAFKLSTGNFNLFPEVDGFTILRHTDERTEVIGNRIREFVTRHLHFTVIEIFPEIHIEYISRFRGNCNWIILPFLNDVWK